MRAEPSGEEESFDAGRPYELDPHVAIRAEPFGGLAYHYGNRRLTLINTRALFDALFALRECPRARDALAARVPCAQLPAYEGALARLFAAGVIRAR